jgi:hypothetical protein
MNDTFAWMCGAFCIGFALACQTKNAIRINQVSAKYHKLLEEERTLFKSYIEQSFATLTAERECRIAERDYYLNKQKQ